MNQYSKMVIMISGINWIAYASLLSKIELDFIQQVSFWALIFFHWWLVINHNFIIKSCINGNISKTEVLVKIFNISYILTFFITLTLNYKFFINSFVALSSIGAFTIYSIFKKPITMDSIVQPVKNS